MAAMLVTNVRALMDDLLSGGAFREQNVRAGRNVTTWKRALGRALEDGVDHRLHDRAHVAVLRREDVATAEVAQQRLIRLRNDAAHDERDVADPRLAETPLDLGRDPEMRPRETRDAD